MNIGSLVLIIESEQLLREALEDILDLAGLRTVSTSNGNEGITLYGRLRDRITLVVLDVRLPGTEGMAILEKLRAINPAVKVIVSSSYDEEEVSTRLNEHSPLPALQKPYNAQVFLSKVKEVIHL